MYSIYRFNVDELDAKFVDSLKLLFKGKEIEMMVTPAEEQHFQQSEDEKIMQQRSILQAIEEDDVKRFI